MQVRYLAGETRHRRLAAGVRSQGDTAQSCGSLHAQLASSGGLNRIGCGVPDTSEHGGSALGSGLDGGRCENARLEKPISAMASDETTKTFFITAFSILSLTIT
ncbi:MAG: hypothetical protein ACLFTD_10725 [Halochromatium sp.]